MDVFIVTCGAPDEYFEIDPERVDPELMHELEGCGMPCDGGGVPGWWCSRCPYKLGDLADSDEVLCD